MRIMIILFLLAQGAIAETIKINDPRDFLRQFYQSTPERNFEEFTSCSNAAVFSAPVTSVRIQCSSGPFPFAATIEMETCKVITQQDEYRIEEVTVPICQSDRAVFLSSLGPVLRLSRDSYEREMGQVQNFIEDRLSKLIRIDLNFTIQKVKTQKKTFHRGKPNQQKVLLWNFFGQARFVGTKHDVPFLLTLSHDTPGIAHIVRFQMDNTLWLYLKDYSF